MPGCNDKFQIGMAVAQLGESIEDEFFFPRHCACRDPNRLPAGEKLLEPGLERFPRGNGVIFEVPQYSYPLRIGPNGLDPLPVRLGLHSNDRVILKDALEPMPDQPVSVERSIGDAPIDHHDAYSADSAFAKKIRPDLRLRNDDDLWSDPIQHTAHAPRQIDRKIECAVNDVAPLAGERLPCGCDGRNHERVVGELLTQSFKQSLNRFDFTDRYRVYPNGSLHLRQFHQTKTIRHSGKILSKPNEIVRECQQQAHCQSERVYEIHVDRRVYFWIVDFEIMRSELWQLK